MGMPAILARTGVGQSGLWCPDFFQNPFNIGIGCVIAGGPPTYNIEHTFDDPNVVGSPVWFVNSGINGAVANANGNYQFPVRAIRINITGGSGTVTATLIQATYYG